MQKKTINLIRILGLIVVIALIVIVILFIQKTNDSPNLSQTQTDITPENLNDIEEKDSSDKINNSSNNFQTLRPEIAKKGDFIKSPELAGIKGYINTEDDLRIKNLRGKVVLVDFWTYSCINCLRTLPYLIEWDNKYRDKGLVIIGVHTPEFDFEKDYNNVLNFVKDKGIEYAVVQDNDYATWRAFNNRYWPRKYLIDADGFIRYDHIGEGGYEETEKMIQLLLSEAMKENEENKDMNAADDIMQIDVVKEESKTYLPLTPELYAGYDFALPRGQDIGGDEQALQPNKVINYRVYDLDMIKKDTIYLEGRWLSNPDKLTAQADPLQTSSIYLDYTASEVNIVAEPLIESSIKLYIELDGEAIDRSFAGDDVMFDEDFGKTRAFIVVDKPRLYNIVDGEYARHLLKLYTDPQDDSFEFSFNAFTFG